MPISSVHSNTPSSSRHNGARPSGNDPSREPKVLIFADDPERKPRLYACPTCGSVHSPAIYLATSERAHQAAIDAARDCYTCKTHNVCQYCGDKCDKHWTACETCRYQRKLDAALEIPDDGGPYCAFDGDTYFSFLEEAEDAGLEWVSPCEITYPSIDPDSVLENLLSDMHEDVSVDDLDGVEAFYEAVKVFNEAQRCQSWFGDVKRKIRVPASAIDARSGETAGLDPKGESAVRDSGDAQ